MIVDTSVLVALLREEAITARFVPILLENAGNLKMSAANYLEAAIVVDANEDQLLSERLDAVIHHFGIEIVSVTAQQARMARDAYRRFGKGRHPAKLNFGDVFAYALAWHSSEPLLFKGDDFTKTDIASAL